jgi:hypothetical protein
MNNITYAKNMENYLPEKRRSKPVTEVKPEIIKDVKVVDVKELLIDCDKLSRSITDIYGLRSHKELNDALTNLSLVKKSLQSLSKN